MYSNVQSLCSKISELQLVVNQINPDIVLLTETWLNQTINNAAISIDGYDIVPDLRCDRGETAGGVGGGLLVYVKREIRLVPLDATSRFYQHCRFQILTGGEKLNFILIYRPPSTGTDNTELLYDLVESVGRNTFIIGDFNMPGINWVTDTASGRGGRRLLQAATGAGLAQLVEGPTHTKGNLLDLILTDMPHVVLNVKDEGRLGNSDHIMISAELDVDVGRDIMTGEKYNWSRADFDGIRDGLLKINWREKMVGLDTESCWELFRTQIEKVTDEFVPKSKPRRSDRPKWLTRDIIAMLRQKKKAWRKYKNDMSLRNKEEYEEQAKKVKKTVRRAKTGMEKKLAHSKDDNGRKFRNYIKSRTRMKPKVGPLTTDYGEVRSDPLEMADELNKYFGSVFTHEDVSNVPVKQMETEVVMPNVSITEKKICEKIFKLRKDAAPGPDNITPLFLKETVHVVKIPLKIIFEKSLKEQKCPADWKMAHVVPIYKKGPKGKPSNYRPVSLTSIPCKILEQIIKDELSEHLARNRLINDSQHGFTKGKSCATNLIQFFDKVSESMDEGVPIDIFHLDFSKAFDKVPHERLLEKVRAKGVGVELLGWLRDWLTGRKQKVLCEGHLSTECSVKSGVPQGTVLGPPLFNIFIDDIDEAASLINLLLKFADDTKGMQAIKTDQDKDLLQETLDKLYEWSQTWGMEFNVDKCKIMHVGRNNPEHRYSMGGVELTVVEEEKDVGVLIHKSLKPGRQCKKAADTATGVLHQILNNFHFRDRHIFMKLYKQYVRPHLEFATPAWNPWLKKDIEILENVQIKAVNMVSGLKGNLYEDKCKELELDTLAKRRENQDLMQTFKIVKKIDKLSPSKIFKNRETAHNTRSTADGNKFTIPRTKTDIRANFFSIRAAKNWNELDQRLKELPLPGFKAAIKSSHRRRGEAT